MRAVRASAFLSVLLLRLICAAGHEVEEHQDEEEEEEEEGKEVLARTDGFNIACCILGIMTALILITMWFEGAKEHIYEKTPVESKPIVDALFSEMTVLGFLSMVTFVVASQGIITKISVAVFGDSEEGKAYLKDLFEQAHYMLFLVMVLFFATSIYILHANSRSIHRLSRYREDLFNGGVIAAMKARVRDVPCPWLFGRAEWLDAACFLEYYSLRQEFIRGRQAAGPHDELPLEERLSPDFNYAKYLTLMLGQRVAEVIEVGPNTWFQLWVLNLAVYGLMWKWPLEGAQCVVVCGAWIALGFAEAAFIYVFYNKVANIRLCLCSPSEIPHVAFAYEEYTGHPIVLHNPSKQRARYGLAAESGGSGGSTGTLRNAAQHRSPSGTHAFEKLRSGKVQRHQRGSYQALIDNDHDHGRSRTGGGGSGTGGGVEMGVLSSSSSSSGGGGGGGGHVEHKATDEEEEAEAEAAAEEEGLIEDRERDLPPWTHIHRRLALRGRLAQWAGGRAPFRQMFLYWCQANGPELHVALLRLHLVYIAIQATLVALVFAPIVKHEFGFTAYVAYLLLPLLHLVPSVGWYLPDLVKNVVETGCVGILADPKMKKAVLREMKTEQSVKGLMLLTNMRHFLRSGHTTNTKHKTGTKGDDVESTGHDQINDLAVRLFNGSFDTQGDGVVLPVDFALALSHQQALGSSLHLNDAEVALAFAMFDSEKLGKIDQATFVRFFKMLSLPGWGKQLDLSGAEAHVGAKLHEAVAVLVVAEFGDRKGEYVESAEDELARLHRDHGRAVHEIIQLFEQHDVNGDGVLSPSEVRVMVNAISSGPELSAAETALLVAHLDRDGDGEVSMAEFAVWAFRRQNETEEDDIEELAGDIFDEVFDDDGSGQIDVNEFIIGLEKVKSDLSYDEKHDLFRSAAGDDLAISREEFIELMVKFSE